MAPTAARRPRRRQHCAQSDRPPARALAQRGPALRNRTGDWSYFTRDGGRGVGAKGRASPSPATECSSASPNESRRRCARGGTLVQS